MNTFDKYNSALFAPDWLVRIARDAKKKKRSPKEKAHSKLSPTVAAVASDVHPYVSSAMKEECEAVAAAQEGCRNDTLNKAAFALGQFVGSGNLDEDYARQRLRESVQVMQDPLPDDEMERTIESGITAGKEEPRDIPERNSESNVSEESIAASFAVRYGDTLKYCAEFGTWLEWDPERHIWVQDSKNRTFHYARQECRAANPKNKPTLGKASTAKGVERFACADPKFATVGSQWDSYVHMLGTPGGVIDLNIGGQYARP